MRNAAWLALLLTIPVSVAAWYSSPILVLLGQEQQVADSGQSYLRYLLWGLLPSLWFAVLTEFLAAHARPRAVYVVTLIAIALNALLDYALMFGNLGAPNMGLEGAGVASLVVSWFMFLALLIADAVQIAARGALQGLKDTTMPMVIALATGWGMGFPTAVVLGFVLDFGGPGIWAGMAVAMTAAAWLVTKRFRRQARLFATQA